MANLNITPSSALLIAGQALTLQATDDSSKPVSVIWTLTPPLGSLVTVPPTGGNPTAAPSATYIAPSIVQTSQTVAITATSSIDTASVTLALTPNAISIVPATVCLHAGQPQQFEAIAPTGYEVTWTFSPQVGTMTGAVYTAPDPIPDDGTLTVTATSKQLGIHADAKVTLTPEPWRGLGPVLLAAYLFLVFSVVYLMIELWPGEIPNIDLLKADQATAQSNLDKSTLALQNALATVSGSTNSNPTNNGGAAASKTAGASPDTTPAGSARQQASDALLRKLTADNTQAQQALDVANGKLTQATSATVDTRIRMHFNREIDLLCLVLLAGALGSFLHMAQSFSAFAGNRTLKSSWVWWYAFLPFVGAGLAMVLYAALRGGLITVATSSGVKATDLNPYGLVAAAALAGMFSEAATTKLGEVFDTLFQTSKGEQNKDPLKPDSQSSQPAAKPGATGGAAVPAAGK